MLPNCFDVTALHYQKEKVAISCTELWSVLTSQATRWRGRVALGKTGRDTCATVAPVASHVPGKGPETRKKHLTSRYQWALQSADPFIHSDCHHGRGIGKMTNLIKTMLCMFSEIRQMRKLHNRADNSDKPCSSHANNIVTEKWNSYPIHACSRHLELDWKCYLTVKCSQFLVFFKLVIQVRCGQLTLQGQGRLFSLCLSFVAQVRNAQVNFI